MISFRSLMNSERFLHRELIASAPLAVFLASDESAWITGEVIRAADGFVVAA